MRYARVASLSLPLMAALVISGCATKQPGGRASRASAVRAGGISPAEFMAAAASSALLMIRASDLVAARERNSQIAQTALRLKEEQTGIGAQLSYAGRRVDLLPSSSLLPRHQKILNEIAASDNPGETYVRHMQTLIPQSIALHRQYELTGSSPSLRPVAGMAAPILERELTEVRKH